MTNPSMGQNGRNQKVIGICHYKIGRTDGVSLEIAKREKMLKGMGYRVILIAGTSGFSDEDQKNHNIFIIPELDFDYPKGHSDIDMEIDIENIKKNAFAGFQLNENDRYDDEETMLDNIDMVADRIAQRFLEKFDENDLDYLFLHNIFSHGRHIAAAKAFYKILTQLNVRAIAVNHDFYESYEDRYSVREGYGRVQAFLEKYVPPTLARLKHVTINSIWKNRLERKLDQKAGRLDTEIIVFPDTFEFEQDPWIADDHNGDMLPTFQIKSNDLFILQATRIVRRKAIELTIDLVAELNARERELIGRRLYNGKVLDETSDIVLAFAQSEEQDAKTYKQALIDHMHAKGVRYRFLYDRIGHARNENGENKQYSLWDAYVFADMVSYPSIWEGFGNQFLEAVFAKKPIILFEYPVFIADIRQGGYHYVRLGSKTGPAKNDLATIPPTSLTNAATAAIDMLTIPQTVKRLDQYFQRACDNYGDDKLRQLLLKCLA
jgi:glycosyltransferase involved in cell wall biosynthesis